MNEPPEDGSERKELVKPDDHPIDPPKESEAAAAAAAAESIISPEILNEMPADMRQMVERSIFLSMQRTGPLPSPLAEKIKPEHIDKILDNAERDAQRDSDDRKLTKIFVFAVIVAIVAILVLLLFIPTPSPFAQEALMAVLTFLGGGLAGFGIGKYTK